MCLVSQLQQASIVSRGLRCYRIVEADAIALNKEQYPLVRFSLKEFKYTEIIEVETHRETAVTMKRDERWLTPYLYRQNLSRILGLKLLRTITSGWLMTPLMKWDGATRMPGG